MLVLSRQRQQRIFIGQDIVVTVVSIDRGKVRIGVSAPPGVEVDREEVRNLKAKIQSEKKTP